jgi:DNA-binding PadR family transcriptional regulator
MSRQAMSQEAMFEKPSMDPLTEPVLLILVSLAERPRHGYSILKDVEKVSNGRVLLSTGTLYGALRRLLDDGLVERFEEDDSTRGRRAYRLTLLGSRALDIEVARLKQLTRVASQRAARNEA